jgi:ribosomal protein L29
MKKTKYAGQKKEDLIKSLYEKRENLRNFRFGEAGAKTTNVKQGSALRKDIARILSELNK